MRFAERLHLTRHAGTARLQAIAAGAPATPHVDGCADCQARLAERRAWTRATAADAADAADAVFTPARLAAQRASILRRLEAAGRSARVIAFPHGAPAPATIRTASVLRWTAGAAAAGLMIGVATGHLLEWHPEGARTVAAVPAPAVPLSRIVSSPPSQDAPAEALDEEGLLEAAYDRVSVDALEAIDDITPRAREFARSAPPRRFP